MWAVDGGEPPRTATATLLLNVADVNDNPPHVKGPPFQLVPENSSPRHVADVKLSDADDWSQGHGPPFTIALDPHAPEEVKRDFSVTFDASKCV